MVTPWWEPVQIIVYYLCYNSSPCVGLEGTSVPPVLLTSIEKDFPLAHFQPEQQRIEDTRYYRAGTYGIVCLYIVTMRNRVVPPLVPPHGPVLVPGPPLARHRPVQGAVQVGGGVRPGVPRRHCLCHKVCLLPA